MIKNQKARVYYTVWLLATGEPYADNQVNHTIYYSANTEWTQLSNITITSMGNGVFSFELPATYTNVSNAVCRITSTNENVMIPPVELHFEEPMITASDIEDTIFDHDIGDSITFESAISEVYDDSSSMASSISTMSEKLEGYPAGGTVAQKTDIPSAATIARTLLITNVSNYSTDIGEYSVGAMVLGGFCSVLDPATGAWTIKLPNGTAVAVRSFTTSDSLKPIVSVQ